MFVEETTASGIWSSTAYAHCEGCGMEYELDSETGVLKYWNDGVGLVRQTMLSGPNDWQELVARHGLCSSEPTAVGR